MKKPVAPNVELVVSNLRACAESTAQRIAAATSTQSSTELGYTYAYEYGQLLATIKHTADYLEGNRLDLYFPEI